MQTRDVSVIVAVYKDTAALSLVLEGFARQSARGFEVVIAEDGEDPGVRSFVRDFRAEGVFDLVHTTQADTGWRKNASLNNGVRAARGKLLVFVDGDCVPHARFVEAHARLAQKGTVLSGRRVMLGPRVTRRLLDRALSLDAFERSFWFRIPSLLLDGSTHLEEGIYLDPAGWLGRLARKRTRNILGCNFGCLRQDLESINGFDEDYLWPRAGEDNDLLWRFEKVGVRLVSARNVAVQYHLHHERPHYTLENRSLSLMREKMRAGRAYCENGLVKRG